ncbi:redoxin domain-containing protein [Lacinutrix iliipiscaria]|uniref:Redoxin domain-containing protein n=1 Tax=Lacinutrix iliipiscaria TaxID=1230532 RepID=A0ABW5WQ87_9FLAO
MKSILYILCISLVLVSCKNESKTESSDGFLIQGRIDNAEENTLVTLLRNENRQEIILDSTRINGNTFELKGNVESPDMYFIAVDGVQGGLPIIIENETIDINIYSDSISASTIKGGKENNYFNEYQEFVKSLRSRSNKLAADYQVAQQQQDTARIAALRKEYDGFMKENLAHDLEFMTKNEDAILSALILERALMSKQVEFTKIEDLYTNFNASVKNSRSGKVIADYISKNKKTAIGSIAPNFSAPTPDGKTLALNDIKGKVTIIDFWAAWCGPCRRENPNVVKVYEKYHDKGLEIIGVSLDGTPQQKDAKQAWIAAIAQDKLTWHQVSNLQYFNDPIAKEFNINSIPATFILDADGKIVAKDLRGQALDNKIAELLD